MTDQDFSAKSKAKLLSVLISIVSAGSIAGGYGGNRLAQAEMRSRISETKRAIIIEREARKREIESLQKSLDQINSNLEELKRQTNEKREEVAKAIGRIEGMLKIITRERQR